MDEPVVTVRTGVLEDLDAMMRLADSAASDNGFLRAAPGKILHDVYSALTRQGGIVGVIGEPGGELEAAVLLMAGPIWYSEETVLEEKALFVAPAFRTAKGGRARKLCEFAKKTADELGLPLAIGVLSNHRTAGKIKLYERIFGPAAGVYFLHNAKTGAFKEAAE